MSVFEPRGGSQSAAPAVQPASGKTGTTQQPQQPQPQQPQQQTSKPQQQTPKPQQQQQRLPTSAINAAAQGARLRSKSELEQTKAELEFLRNRMTNFAKSRNYDSWDEMEQENAQELLSKGEISPGVFYPYIAPQIRQEVATLVKPLLDYIQGTAESAQVDQALREFQTDFPELGVQSVNDFAKFANEPWFEKFYNYLDKDLSYSDAYRLANPEGVSARVQQQVRNSINGKEHLKQQEGSADDLSTVTVPPRVAAYYRKLNPDMTDAQIREHYAKQIQKAEGMG